MLDTNILGGDLSAIIDVPNLVQDIHYLLEGFMVYTMLKQHFSLFYVRHKHPGGGDLSAIIDVPNLVQDIHHLLEGFMVYTMLKQHFSLFYVRHKHPGGIYQQS